MRDPNRELLLSAARLLKPLLGELVFVGGCSTGLLITDDAASAVRATIDVDAIAEISSYPEYIAFSERLRNAGFTEDTREGAPLCRWIQGDVTLDVMPLDAKILGFSNRWYRAAIIAAEVYMLEPSLQIRSIRGPILPGYETGGFQEPRQGRVFQQPRLGGCTFGHRWADGVATRGANGDG